MESAGKFLAFRVTLHTWCFRTFRKLGQIGQIDPRYRAGLVVENQTRYMVEPVGFSEDTEVPAGLRARWYDFWYD